MTIGEEAEKAYINLKGDALGIARYIVERCGDFFYDKERVEFIAEFLRVSSRHIHDEEFTRGMCDYKQGLLVCILTKGHVERAKTPHTDAEGAPMGPVKEPPLLQCVACRNTESCAGAMAREHWHPGLCMHCGGAFRVVRA